MKKRKFTIGEMILSALAVIGIVLAVIGIGLLVYKILIGY